MAWELSVLWDPSVRPVALGTAVLGAVSGMLGTFAVVRRQSLVGDAVAHAALPGVALAYLLGGTHEIVLVLGAAFTGWLATLVVTGVILRSRVSFDAAPGGSTGCLLRTRTGPHDRYATQVSGSGRCEGSQVSFWSGCGPHAYGRSLAAAGSGHSDGAAGRTVLEGISNSLVRSGLRRQSRHAGFSP
jgi:hypothetical protein